MCRARERLVVQEAKIGYGLAGLLQRQFAMALAEYGS